MAELVLAGKTYSVDPQYLQGALAALIDLGWGGISVDPHYSRVYQVVPSPEKSTVLLNQTAYQFPRNKKAADDFLTGAKAVYDVLGKKFSGRIQYTKIVNLDKDVLGVIATNADPLTQLYMKHVAKTKLSPHVREYEKLFREKNYDDLLILAANNGDIETIRKVLPLRRSSISDHIDSDEKMREILEKNDVGGNNYLIFETFTTPVGGLSKHRYRYPEFSLNNEAAAIAVSQNRLEILQLLESFQPPNNYLSLIEIAIFRGYEEIADYINKMHPDYPHRILLSFAIRGKQVHMFKKYLKTATDINHYKRNICLMIYEYGTPEMYEDMKSMGLILEPLTNSIYSMVNNEDMFRYIYNAEREKIWIQSSSDEDYEIVVQNLLMSYGMVEELKMFREVRRRNDIPIDEESLIFAIDSGNVEMIRYVLSLTPIRLKNIEFFHSFIDRNKFRILVENDGIGLDSTSTYDERIELAHSLVYYDWETAVEVFNYLDVPLTPFDLSPDNRSVEYLRYYHQHNPQLTEYNILDFIPVDYQKSIEFIPEFEKLYGPVDFNTLQESLIHAHIEVFIYLVKTGRIKKSEIDWTIIKNPEFVPTFSPMITVERYIEKLHEMNQYKQLLDNNYGFPDQYVDF